MEGSVGWGWFSAVRFGISNVALLVPGSAFLLALMILFTPTAIAAVVGAMLGICSGVVFGRLNGRFIVDGLTRDNQLSRRLRDPTPLDAVLTLAPVAIICGAWVAAFGEPASDPGVTELVVGCATFFFWQGAMHSAGTLRALWKFERISGRRVQAKMAWAAGFTYRAG